MPSFIASPLTPVERAARWLAKKPVGSVTHTLPTLMKRFDLSPSDGIRAIRRANALRAEVARRPTR
jgi:hypothetical protein